MDRLTAMRSFVEVAHCASFTKASERLGLSRLQVSRHVNEVEQWLEATVASPNHTQSQSNDNW